MGRRSSGGAERVPAGSSDLQAGRENPGVGKSAVRHKRATARIQSDLQEVRRGAMVPGDLRRRIQAQSLVLVFAPDWDIDAELGIPTRGGGEQSQLQRYTLVAQLLRSLVSCWIDSAVAGARSIRTRAMRLWS